ncbi:MAG TPA: hypothetical protein VNT25_06785 [Allosphingosinicella sp.]|nr:hypothetical protein [Allosphingosinicella sp.]
MVALVLFGTLALISCGFDLLDGDITLRRLGHLSITETPVRLAMFVVGYLLVLGFTVLGWFVVFAEWNIEYRLPSKVPLEDSEHRRPPKDSFKAW